MKLTDPSSIAALIPADVPGSSGRSSDPSAAAAAEVFAKMLVGELRKTLPEGGLLGDGPFSMLETVLDEALAAQLADADRLGLQRMFGARAPSPEPIPGALRIPHGARPASPAGTAAPRLVEGGRITSRFGPRLHPILGTWQRHDGIDIAAPRGSAIHSAAAGIVRSAALQGGYGNLVVLDHGGGVETRYAHCDAISVEVGQRVEAGEILGTVGSTGRTTGPHLHFELRHDGVAVDPHDVPWPNSPR
ncbi:MAG TPA: M23 family metallopeptidase [Deltaproteobacteria bacterium]|nr:M23 family metallopeptidase [Deltaproteobacteria bacterium]